MFGFTFVLAHCLLSLMLQLQIAFYSSFPLLYGFTGFADRNNLYPGDILPFTRRPLFLIVDSDISHAFKAGLS